MQVARALTQKKFLSGAYAIEYIAPADMRLGAYSIHLVEHGR